MKKLTLEMLEKHEDETINSLDEMIDEIHCQISILQDEIDTINALKMKFQSQILLRGLRLKKEDTN